MTPFELDAVVNPEIQQKKGAINASSSMTELKRRQEMMGDLYVDEDDDTRGCRLYDKDFEAMQAFERHQILMGIDLEDPDETQKGKTRQQIQAQQERQAYIN